MVQKTVVTVRIGENVSKLKNEGLPSDFIQELAARVDEEGFEQVRKNCIVTCNFLHMG